MAISVERLNSMDSCLQNFASQILMQGVNGCKVDVGVQNLLPPPELNGYTIEDIVVGIKDFLQPIVDSIIHNRTFQSFWTAPGPWRR
jgi:hypothetical protein